MAIFMSPKRCCVALLMIGQAAALSFLMGACSRGEIRGKVLGIQLDPAGGGGGGGSPANQLMRGNLDGIDSQTFIATGWCFDPDSAGTALSYEAYVNGNRQSGALAFSGQTSVSRPDVNQVHSVSGSHGFSAVIPAALRSGSGGAPTLSVYCRDPQSGEWGQISGSPRAFGVVGGLISKVRAKNPTTLSRNAPVSAVISLARGAVADVAQLQALGLTVDGTPASAIPMEFHYRSSDGSIESIALAKVVSRAIPFAPQEERVLEVRADGVATPAFELTQRMVELLQPSGLYGGFYLEVEGLDGQKYRAFLGDQNGQQSRILEQSSTSITFEVRGRFLNESSTGSPSRYPSLSSTFYLTLYSGSDTALVRMRVANDITSEPVSGGVFYRSLSVVFDQRLGIRFDLNRALYGSGAKQVRPDGLTTLCLDGACLGENLLSGSSSAPVLQPMVDGRIGDGQSLLVSGAITRYLDSEQSGPAASSHLAMGEAQIIAIQQYDYTQQSWSGTSPVGFFHTRRFNEAQAEQVRAANSGLCGVTASPKRTLGTNLDPLVVPYNPGGTGDQPQFHSNGLPELGWKTLWAEDNCSMLSFLRKMEREWLRGQLYFEVRDGVDQPRTVTLADRLPQDNYWANKPFDGNGGSQVNAHNPYLRSRSGSGWNAGVRTETWTCWGTPAQNVCGFRRVIGELNGWNDQHMSPGFILMGWRLTGDPVYKQLIEAFQTSVYLLYLNDWANGLVNGSWMRVSAHRALGRVLETAIWLIRASDGTERAQVLREGIARKVQAMAIPSGQNMLQVYPNPATGLGLGFAPENANVQSIAFCGSGLHTIAGQSFPANCAWYASQGAPGQYVNYPPVLCTPGVNCPARYFTHWQYGFVMNAMTMMIGMGIAPNEAQQMIRLYMDKATMVHAPNGAPYPLVLHDDPDDRITSGYHVWWMLAGAYAATYAKDHPAWPFFRDQVIPWHMQSSNPGTVSTTPGTNTYRQDAFWLDLQR